MDSEALVDQVKAAVDAFRQMHGPVALAMLEGTSETDKSWNLVFAAPALDGLSAKEGVDEVIKVVRGALPRGSWPAISRVTVLRSTDALVDAMSRIFRVSTQGWARIINCQVNSIEIPYAILVAADGRAATSRHSRAAAR